MGVPSRAEEEEEEQQQQEQPERRLWVRVTGEDMCGRLQRVVVVVGGEWAMCGKALDSEPKMQ